jgi:hypothetical protein
LPEFTEFIYKFAKNSSSYNREINLDDKADLLHLSPSLVLEDVELSENDIIIVEAREKWKNWCATKTGMPKSAKCEGCTNFSDDVIQCVCKKVRII